MSRTLKKKTSIPLLCTLLFALCPCSEAQQATKIARVGVLPSGSPSSAGTRVEAFRQALRELGYVEGKNILFEYRYGEGKREQYRALADELVRLKTDIIVVSSTGLAVAAKEATKTIPIVVAGLGTLLGTGVVASLAGNRLELLKQVIPQLSRIAILWNPNDLSSAQQWKETQHSARELALQLHSMEVSSAEKYAGAFKEAIKAGSNALSVMPVLWETQTLRESPILR